jgi:mRNA interferase MazF
MGKFVKGDVVVLPFPFSDLSAGQNRPALVIASLQPHDDLILWLITSRNTKDAGTVPLTRAALSSGGLPIDSNVRPYLINGRFRHYLANGRQAVSRQG